MENLVIRPFGDFYSGKRVFVTGHTGFKGGWLSIWLKMLGAEVWGLSLPPGGGPNLHELVASGTFADNSFTDIRDLSAVSKAIIKAAPDIVFHLAAQPIVRRSYADPVETFGINALGTAHLLEAVRRAEIACPVVVVTTDKCYENVGWEHGYRETDPLGGHDLYAASKAAAELAVQAWRRSFFQPNPKLGNVATVRAGNVIGGGDYAENRIVPDCVRALTSHQPIQVRNPAATRPWQHVLDCLSGYLWLGARLGKAGKDTPLACAFNFGPGNADNQPVRRLVEEILRIWPGRWETLALQNAPHEAALLHLSTDKAAARLNWFPTWRFADTVQQTMRWYYERHQAGNRDMHAFSIGQIEQFTRDAAGKGIEWACPA